jgi:hypothetical protein
LTVDEFSVNSQQSTVNYFKWNNLFFGVPLTVTQGVKLTGASFAEVEATLNEMYKSGYVKIDNDPNTGAVIYHFHEL